MLKSRSLLAIILLAAAILYGFGAAKGLTDLVVARHLRDFGGLAYYVSFLIMLPWAIALPFIISRAAGLTIACAGTVSFLITFMIRAHAPTDYWLIVFPLAIINALPLIGAYLISEHAVSRRRMTA